MKNFLINHKKIVYIFVLSLVLVALLNFALLSPPKPSVSNQPTPTINPYAQTPRTTVIPINYPYKDPDGKFLISHYPTSDSYSIVLLTPPFDQIRQLAEAAFLQQLNVNKTNACLMKVTLSTPRFVNPDQAGQMFPLSFCAPKP